MAKIDSYVTIGFKGDKKQLEKDIKDVDRQLAQYDKEREKLNKDIVDTESNIKGYKIETKHYDRLISKSNDYKEQLAKLNSELTRLQENRASFIAISDKRKEIEQVDREYKRINDQLNREANKNEQIIEKYDEAKIKLEEMKIELNKINKLQEETAMLAGDYRSQLQDVNNKITIQQQQQQKVAKFNRDIKKFGSSMNNSMEKLVKKTVKWGLVIFGVRSAYSLISRSMSILSQYDKQLSTNIEYIRWTLATALKPVIEWIIKAVFKLIQFINTLIYRLTGVNLLANATPQKFKETTKELKKTNKQAEELHKQLTGFDEMNILGDNTKSADSGAGTPTPSFNLSELMPDAEFNKIMNKAKVLGEKAGDSATRGLFGVLGYAFPEQISKLVNKTKGIIKEKVKDIWDVIEDKIFILIDGSKLIGSFIKMLLGDKKDTDKNVKEFMLRLEQFAEDVKKLFSDLIKLVVPKIVRDGISNIGKLFNNFKPTANTTSITQAFDKLGQKAKDVWAGIKKTFGDVGTFFKNTFTDAWTKVKNVFSTGGKIFDGIKDGIVNSFKTIVNKLIDGIEKVVNKPFEKINNILNDIKGVNVLGIKPFNKLWKTDPISVPKMPRLKTGAVINQPGRGVFHNGAIMGEAGAEGILPLTDESAMELLGRTIGKYVTIQANITNNMNGRLISRIVQEIMAEQDFAYNR